MMMLVLKLAIGALVFGTGMSASREDLFWIWKKPAVLARAFLAMYVLIPLVAVLIVDNFDLTWGTKAALLFISISAGAPLLPKKLIKIGGDPAYLFSLVVATSLLAIVTVPVSLSLLRPWLPGEAGAEPIQVAGVILKTFLIPLIAGMLVAEFLPRFADKIGDPLMRISGLALAVGAIALIGASWSELRDVSTSTFVAFGGFTLAALLIGHLLGGPEHRSSLAVASATRHIGLALLIAANVRGPKTLVMVAAYLLAAALVSFPYLRWARSRQSV